VTTTFLSWVLILTPEVQPPPFVVDVVTVDRSDGATQIIAYDADGDVTGEITVWSDGDGRVRLDVTFADGEFSSMVFDGENVTTESSNGALVEERVIVMEDVMHETDSTKGWVPCAVHTGLAISSCAAALLWCPFEAAFAACECLPELVSEWSDYHCPGFG
jgi:hypothetical protein